MNILNNSIVDVKGIGEDTVLALSEIGIHSIKDLLEYFPYRYDDYRIRELAEVKHEERITVEGKVHSEVIFSYFGKKKSRISFRLLVSNYLVTIICFNRPYLKKQIGIGDILLVSGKWDQHRQTITASSVKKGNKTTENPELVPVYRVSGDVTVSGLRRFIGLAIEQYGDKMQEILPHSFLERYKLLTRKEAIKYLHFPITPNHLKHARRRFIYEEFLLFQLKMQAFRKYNRDQSKGVEKIFLANKVQSFVTSLPFALTESQKNVVTEILNDMKSPIRMNRLLQGDVGSGKTVVAAICLYAVVQASAQGALMVPTEILADQHAQSLQELFQGFSITVSLLTSSVKGKKRKEILRGVESGEIDIIVGTHSLIQDEVNFKKLGLVITDEQHRFGVEQRRILREKGEQPDVLFMTATPIPRTLAITVFGDMDVSVINEMPAGRKKIETYWAKHDMLDRVLHFMEKEVNKGRQAYVICPLIEESEKLDVQNALDVHSMLQNHYGGHIKVGLMHGRLSATEKEDVMQKFSTHHYDVLVSTTVVEVGVNVVNATLMIIYDADRFGLSQLHQLRGRVGRGQEQSYCILLADPKSETGKERMRIMTETTDGFELSQKDLELRGPGDFFGKKQSGMPEFKIADMIHDYKALETARIDAASLISSSEFWENKEFKSLRLYVEEILHANKLD